MPAKPNGRSRKVTAAVVGGLFFPQSRSLGIDQREASALVLEKITYAGTASRSHAEGSQFLEKLAGLVVDEKQVERLTRAIGEERLAERAAAVQAFEELPLSQKFAVPAGRPAPDLAVVMADGGRMQILDRSGTGNAGEAALPEAAPSAGVEEDWEEEGCAAKGHWREDKIGLLMTMQSTVSAADPCPLFRNPL